MYGRYPPRSKSWTTQLPRRSFQPHAAGIVSIKLERRHSTSTKSAAIVSSHSDRPLDVRLGRKQIFRDHSLTSQRMQCMEQQKSNLLGQAHCPFCAILRHATVILPLATKLPNSAVVDYLWHFFHCWPLSLTRPTNMIRQGIRWLKSGATPRLPSLLMVWIGSVWSCFLFLEVARSD